MNFLKQKKIENLIKIALNDVIDCNGLPIDESDSVSPKSFLELVSQYTKSIASDNEVKTILENTLEKKLILEREDTLKEILLKYIDENKIISKNNSIKKKFRR